MTNLKKGPVRMLITTFLFFTGNFNITAQLYLSAYRSNYNGGLRYSSTDLGNLISTDSCRTTKLTWELYPSCTYINYQQHNDSLTIEQAPDIIGSHLLSNDTITWKRYPGITYMVRVTGLGNYIRFPTRIDYRIYGHVEKQHRLFYHQAVTYVGLADTFLKVYICHERTALLNGDTIIHMSDQGKLLNLAKLPRKKDLLNYEYYLYVWNTRNNVIYLFNRFLCYSGMMKFYPYSNDYFQGSGNKSNVFTEMGQGLRIAKNGLNSLNFNSASEYRRLKRFIRLTKHVDAVSKKANKVNK